MLLRLAILSLLLSRRSAETPYTSIAELQSALNAASPGDTVVVANGRYNVTTSILVKCDGVTVRAGRPGGVIFAGGKINWKVKGSGNTVSGFRFENGKSYENGNVIDIFGDRNTLFDLHFDGYSAKKYISVRAGSQFNTIRNSNFQNKPPSSHQGNLIEIQADSAEPGYHVVRHNSFQRFKGKGGDNGNEPIRLGEGDQAAYKSRTIIEFNVFNGTGLADSETISVKSQENVIRYNTFVDQQNAMLSFRNGNYNVAYGNFFINAGGVRIREASHVSIYNNYFEGSGDGKHFYPLDLADVTEFPGSGAYQVDLAFYHNTVVDSAAIYLGSKTNKVRNVYANNLFSKGGGVKGGVFDGISVGAVFTGNIFGGAAPLGIKDYAGLKKVPDALLGRNKAGYYSPRAASPALGAANATGVPALFDVPELDDDPTVALDVSGRSRPDTSKTVGCGEFFPRDIFATRTGTRALDALAEDDDIERALNRPLSLADVGPSYLQPGAPTAAPVALPSAAPQTAAPAQQQDQQAPPSPAPSADPYNATGAAGATGTATAPRERLRKPVDTTGAMLDANTISQMVIGVVVFAVLVGLATAAFALYRKRQQPPESFQPLTEESDHAAAAVVAAARRQGSDMEADAIDESDAGVEMMMSFGRQAPTPAREGTAPDGPARSPMPLQAGSRDSADPDVDADAASDKSTSALIRPLPAPGTLAGETPRPVAIRLPPPPLSPSPAVPPPAAVPPTS